MYCFVHSVALTCYESITIVPQVQLWGVDLCTLCWCLWKHSDVKLGSRNRGTTVEQFFQLSLQHSWLGIIVHLLVYRDLPRSYKPQNSFAFYPTVMLCWIICDLPCCTSPLTWHTRVPETVAQIVAKFRLKVKVQNIDLQWCHLKSECCSYFFYFSEPWAFLVLYFMSPVNTVASGS